LAERCRFSSQREILNHFLSGTKDIWNEENCRKFLCELAAAKGFDPFIPDNWKNITYRDIKEARVCNQRYLIKQMDHCKQGALGTFHVGSEREKSLSSSH
jgi:hypothetical protein